MLAATVALFACATPASAPSPYLTRAKHPSDRVWIGGQPTAEDLKAIRATGVQVVVNMRTPKEKGVLENERAIVESLGMRYVELPIAGARGMTFEKANALDTLMAQTKDQQILLHCGSGNRVGGLLALIAAKNGMSPDDALAEGIAKGLTKLEPVVKKVLTTCAPYGRTEALPGAASLPARPDVCRGL